ncbi:MAG: site-specific integrase [Candidatus Bathyarchaeota archaeon]
MKGDQLLQFESVKNWFNIQEAKDDIKKTGKRLDDYFEARKKVTSHNTALTALSFIRGFYSHNDIAFPRSMILPKKLEAKVTERDNKTSFYDFDEKTEEFVFKNGKLQQFIQNLNFRDQTIALCLLSTGADATDVLNLKVGFVKDETGKICAKKRFFWHGTRAKTKEPFRTFFSEEATKFLKRYVEQERANASDNEPLFVQPIRKYIRKNPITKEKEKIIEDAKLDSYALSVNFRKAAKEMGYTQKNKPSPFRPKRFRHLFRSACGIAEVDIGYTKSMMGHANDVSAGYLEKDPVIFKKIYLKIEPFLTVFGNNNYMTREFNKLNKDFTKFNRKTLKLEDEATKLKAHVKELKEQLGCAVNYIWSLQTKIEEKEKSEAEEDFKKLVTKINERHPLKSRAKGE